MKKQIILYGSKYGTSEAYAQKLSELTDVPCTSFEDAEKLAEYTRVVYIGGLFGGRVRGLAKTVRNFPESTELILVTVGIADPADLKNQETIRSSLKKQMSPELYKRTKLFHLRGALDYSRIRGIHRFMMKMLCAFLKKQPASEQTADTKLLIDSYGKKVDFVDFYSLRPVINVVKEDQPCI